MTTRRWMIAVAAVALLVGSGIEGRRLYNLSKSYRARAIRAEQDEQRSRTYVKEYAQDCEEWSKRVRDTQLEIKEFAHRPEIVNLLLDTLKGEEDLERHSLEYTEQFATIADYFAALKRKYRRAARYPWLSVAPDPPFPN